MLLWADHRVIRHPYGQREQCFWSIELEGLRSFCGVALFALCFRVLEFFYNSAAVGGWLVPTPSGLHSPHAPSARHATSRVGDAIPSPPGPEGRAPPGLLGDDGTPDTRA